MGYVSFVHLGSGPWHTLGGVWGPNSSRGHQGVAWTKRYLSLSTDGAQGDPCPTACSAPETSATLESLALTFPQLPRVAVPRGPPEEASAQEKRPRRSSPSAHSGNPLVAAMFPAPKPAPDAAGREPGTRRGNRATSRGHRRETATPPGSQPESRTRR